MRTRHGIRTQLPPESTLSTAPPWAVSCGANARTTASVPTYDRIEIRRATTIRGLANATPKVVWTKHATGPMAAHIWAPELHFIDGKWYIYFAAGSSTNIWAIRMYALESSSANPMDDRWIERGQIVTDSDTFALDATTFEHDGKRYLVWAQEDPGVAGDNSSLFIAAMVNPWTLASPSVRIARPEHAWETAGFAVNEGAAVLERTGRVFISYSASATDARYCLGLLTASATDDLLSASSWTKNENPVFVSANGPAGRLVVDCFWLLTSTSTVDGKAADPDSVAIGVVT